VSEWVRVRGGRGRASELLCSLCWPSYTLRVDLCGVEARDACGAYTSRNETGPASRMGGTETTMMTTTTTMAAAECAPGVRVVEETHADDAQLCEQSDAKRSRSGVLPCSQDSTSALVDGKAGVGRDRAADHAPTAATGAADVDGELKPPRPILSVEKSRPCLVCPAHVAPILDMRRTGDVMRMLAQRAPLGSLSHLKRVKRSREDHQLYVVVCSCDDAGGSTLAHLEAFLTQRGLSLSALPGLGEPRVCMVPAHAPLTRPQFDAAFALWPVSTRERKADTDALSGTYFSPAELSSISRFMRVAVQAADDARSTGQLPIGAVAVDPRSGRVIAVAHDERRAHPLNHAVMCLARAVGMVQRPPSRPESAAGGHSPGPKESQCCKDGDGNKVDVDAGAGGEAGGSACESPAASPLSKAEKDSAYLCTGCDVYVTREPCFMYVLTEPVTVCSSPSFLFGQVCHGACAFASFACILWGSA
jgi:tRNA-specific adenosine deaminase 3